jgi:hyperosmotically inducible protein
MTTFTFKKSTIAILILAGSSLNAMAFDTDEIKDNQTAYHDLFKSLDKDNNGVLSKTEVKADTSFKKAHFAKADTDKDGTLSQDEYANEKTKISKAEVGRVASDSWITTKAKSKLLAEESLKSLKISVETHKGEVLLSGFVSSADLKAKAEEIVSGIEGVKSVKNSIEVKA